MGEPNLVLLRRISTQHCKNAVSFEGGHTDISQDGDT
jgi:hypothetical protein